MKSVVKYDLQKRLVKFSADIILNIAMFKKNYAAEHLTKQLIRSTTSAALNYGEAQSAESRKDFIHKMRICLKELRESQVNLEIFKEAGLILKTDAFEMIVNECNELVAIFTASINTTKKKQ